MLATEGGEIPNIASSAAIASRDIAGLGVSQERSAELQHASDTAAAAHTGINLGDYADLPGDVALALDLGSQSVSAVGKLHALSILDRARSLQGLRMSEMAGSLEFEEARDVVSATSKSGLALSTYAPYVSTLRNIGIAAQLIETVTDVALASPEDRPYAIAANVINVPLETTTGVAGFEFGALVGAGLAVAFPPAEPFAVTTFGILGSAGFLGEYNNLGVKGQVEHTLHSVVNEVKSLPSQIDDGLEALREYIEMANSYTKLR